MLASFKIPEIGRENGIFPSSYHRMNRHNKYTVPSFIGMNKKGYSKQLIAKADMHRNIAKRNMMRVMKKN